MTHPALFSESRLAPPGVDPSILLESIIWPIESLPKPHGVIIHSDPEMEVHSGWRELGVWGVRAMQT